MIMKLPLDFSGYIEAKGRVRYVNDKFKLNECMGFGY